MSGSELDSESNINNTSVYDLGIDVSREHSQIQSSTSADCNLESDLSNECSNLFRSKSSNTSSIPINEILSNIINSLLLKLKKKAITDEILDIIAFDLDRLFFMLTEYSDDKSFNYSIITEILSNLNTKYKRTQYFKKQSDYVESVKVPLDSNNKQYFYYYVPLLDTLKNIMKNNELVDFKASENSFSNYTDGSVYKKNSFFNDGEKKIELLIFSDDFNICDPLGGAKT
jgi:hypothetical protein